MLQEISEKDYALRFVADRLVRTLRYAKRKDATNRPEIIKPLEAALAAISHRTEKDRK